VPGFTSGWAGVVGVESYVATGEELIVWRFTEVAVVARWVGVELTVRSTVLLATFWLAGAGTRTVFTATGAAVRVIVTTGVGTAAGVVPRSAVESPTVPETLFWRA